MRSAISLPAIVFSHELGLKNAERGTVERIDGMTATIRWDRGDKVQEIDLGQHRTWDHGYGETVYSAQSKTYDRVYVLAPVNSPLVTGQNYYTAITRARFGARLWTEDRARLVDRLKSRSGEKTSSLEGLGRIERDSVKGRAYRHSERWDQLREQQLTERVSRAERLREEEERRARPQQQDGLSAFLSGRAQAAARSLDQWVTKLLEGFRSGAQRNADESDRPAPTSAPQQPQEHGHGADRGGRHDH
jgi:hypothetical protein